MFLNDILEYMYSVLNNIQLGYCKSQNTYSTALTVVSTMI